MEVDVMKLRIDKYLADMGTGSSKAATDPRSVGTQVDDGTLAVRVNSAGPASELSIPGSITDTRRPSVVRSGSAGYSLYFQT